MAGTWGKWEGSWERESGDNPVADAATEDDPVAIARWLFARDFWLIEEPADSDADGMAALVLDIEDHPVVAAFMSLKYANAFAGEQPELFDNPENIKGFVVTGQDLVLNMPEGSGVLINPGADDERYLPPELIDQIRIELNRSS